MSRRAELLILAVLAAVCGLGFWHLMDAAVVPHVAKGAGPGGVDVTPWGWILTLITGLGTAGFGWNTVLLIVKEVAAHLPAGNPFRRIAVPAVEAGQIAIYQQAYKGAKSDEERTTIRQAAKLASDSLFDEMFPADVPAVEGGAK